MRGSNVVPDKRHRNLPRGSVIYVCHGYSRGNQEQIQKICGQIRELGMHPLVPGWSLPQYLDENGEREDGLETCLQFVELADEVWVFGDITEGMSREIGVAKTEAIPVRYMEERG